MWSEWMDASDRPRHPTKHLVVNNSGDNSPTVRNMKKIVRPGTPVEIEIRCKGGTAVISATTHVYTNSNGDAYLAGAPHLSSIGPGPYEWRWRKIEEEHQVISESNDAPQPRSEHVTAAAVILSEVENAAYDRGYGIGRIAGIQQALQLAEEHAENLRRLLNG